MDITKITSTKLHCLLGEAEAKEYAWCNTFIFTGRGHETHRQIREASEKGHDPDARSYCDCMDRASELRHEKERRLKWHGSTKPIKTS
jgi:hypothetical protein